jgi:hypothetical protein
LGAILAAVMVESKPKQLEVPLSEEGLALEPVG